MFAKLHTGKVIAEVRASAPLPEFKSQCSAVATTPFVLDVQYASRGPQGPACATTVCSPLVASRLP